MEQGPDQPRDHAYVFSLTEEEAYLETDEDEKPEIIVEPFPDPAPFVCSFCRTSARQLFSSEFPVRDPNTLAIITYVHICDTCVTRFVSSLTKDTETSP